jgi:gamma-glutamyltranspeptidase
VRAPRFHQQDSPDILVVESRSLPDDVRNALEAMGHVTKDINDFIKVIDHIADAPAIGHAGGLWVGGAEPRRDGALAQGY